MGVDLIHDLLGPLGHCVGGELHRQEGQQIAGLNLQVVLVVGLGLLLGHVLHHVDVVLADLPLVVGVQQPLDIDGCVVGDAAPAGGQSQQQRPGGQQRSGPFPNSHLSSPLCSLSKTCVRNLQIS